MLSNKKVTNELLKDKIEGMLKKMNHDITLLEKEKRLLLEQYEKTITEKVKQVEQLYTVCYVNLKKSLEVISYLVSKMEEIDYTIQEIPVLLYEKKYISNRGYFAFPIHSNLVCLVPTGKEEIAEKEVQERFKLRKMEEDFDYYGNLKFLKEPSSNYIQLTYYGDYTDHSYKHKYHPYTDIQNRKIEYRYQKYAEVSEQSGKYIYSTICDERYSYIIDYMNLVMDYRLNNPNLDIRLEEMMILADQFIKEYKNVKCLSKKKETI